MVKAAPDESLLGRTIAGKYQIESFVGGGAMGAVYKAKQLALDKTIAVKVLHREIQKDAQFAGRFKREAKAASRLDHPSSLRVIDFGEEPDGLLYMAMEYLDGRDLFEVLRKEFPLSPERIVSILSQALAALQVAHDLGIVHRDLKPENIMILAGTDDEGNPTDVVKVCDFGIAKIVDATRGAADVTDASGRLSTRGLIVGTPEYMSPEQGRGEPLDARADLYSIGVILYQLLTGTVPFEAENAIGVVLKHVTEEPKRPSEVFARADPRLERIALKAMQKDKAKRYGSAREMRADLRGTPEPSATSNPDVRVTPAGVEEPPVSARTFQSAITERAIAPVSGPTPVAATSGPGLPNTESKATLAATTTPSAPEEPLEIPRGTPSWVTWTIAPLVVGVLGAIAFFSLRGPLGATSSGATGESGSASAGAPSAAASVSVGVSPSASASPSASPSASVSASASVKPKATAAVTGANTTTVATEAGAPAEIIDADHAKVVVVATRGDGADAAVRAAIDIAKATQCYRDGLRAPRARGRAFQQTLRVATDANGTINRAAMPAPDFLQSFQECYVEHLIGRKIDGAANAKIEVDLAFSPR